jgi:hypothetical protein
MVAGDIEKTVHSLAQRAAEDWNKHDHSGHIFNATESNMRAPAIDQQAFTPGFGGSPGQTSFEEVMNPEDDPSWLYNAPVGTEINSLLGMFDFEGCQDGPLL